MSDTKTLLKNALLEIRHLRQQLANQQEPIAIIGQACRFPGRSQTPADFWHFLLHKGDAIQEIPPGRWDINAHYDPTPGTPGKTYCRTAAFIDPVDQFDPEFFHISPLEAAGMDPQQRLLLMVAYEALEQAGIPLSAVRGSSAGVFMALGADDYADYTLHSGDPTRNTPYTSLGNHRSIAAGRLAYTFGFHGPTLMLDTACSSSLMAVHLACQSLRQKECDVALAGGVNLILSPKMHLSMASLQSLAPDGRCKTFSAQANGYGRGEGCAVVVLKRLSQATQDGDPILALIRSSAVNHDGASNGLTAPNGRAQEALLRQALSSSGFSPADVQMVETHGTGTKLGDPIEVEAIGKLLGQNRSEPLWLGAVKSNIGHLEAAAGMAGLVKLILSLQHQQILPNLHFTEPNPLIPWHKYQVTVPTEPQPWPAGPHGRVAGLSSFGISGTNVHLILQEAPEATPSPTTHTHHLLTLSAATPAGVQQLAEKYAQALTDEQLAHFATTSHTGRDHNFPYRAAVVGQTAEQLRQQLSHITPVLRHTSPKIAFLFVGQGGQYAQMGRELYHSTPVFRQALEECATHFLTYEINLLALLGITENQISPVQSLDNTRYTQPALFAIQYALAQLWLAWGVEPAALLGHSAGEVVSACLAGVFSLADAIKLIEARGRLMSQLPEAGAMAAVRATASQIAPYLAPFSHQLAIAAFNGPQNLVLSGAKEALETVLQQLEADGFKVSRLNISFSSHSPLVEPILTEYEQTARTLTYHAPQRPLVSTVTGQLVTTEMQTAAYWVQNARQPVQFTAGMVTLHNSECHIFLEVSPKPILLSAGQECLPQADLLWLPTLRPPHPERGQLLTSLGQLYEQGVNPRWSEVYQPDQPRRIAIPTYPFQTQRYWVDPPPTSGNVSQALQNIKPRLTAAEQATVDKILGLLTTSTNQTPPLYELQWQPLNPPTASAASYTWAVVGDFSALPHLLQKMGQQVAEFGPAVERLVYVAPAVSATTPAEMAEQSAQLCQEVVAWLQRASTCPQPPKLWLLTQQAQAVNGEAPQQLGQSPLWGLGRVIALEYPQVWGGQCDVDTLTEAAVLALLNPAGEDQMAIRQQTLYGLRLRPRPAGQPRPLNITADGCYLITGGLGFLGLATARWLVQQGAKKLVLTGRSGLTPAKAEQIEQLKQAGAEVRVAAVDSADEAEMRKLLAHLSAPLRGVIHSAGVAQDKPIDQLTPAAWQAMFRAKVAGSYLLHTLTAHLPLEFFVCYSSAGAVWGAAGQAHYDAANHFMDMLVHQRRAAGLPGLAVNLGLLSQGGMVSDEFEAQLQAIGLAGVPVPEMLGWLGELIQQQTSQATIAQVKWDTFKGVYNARLTRPLLVDLGSKGEKPEEKAAGLTADWQKLPLQQRRAMLQTHIQETVGQLLGYPAGQLPPLTKGFSDLGMDSLMSVEVRRRLERSLGLPLPTTLAFDYPTVQALVQYIGAEVWQWGEVNQLVEKETPPEGNPAGVEADLTAELEDLEKLLKGF